MKLGASFLAQVILACLLVACQARLSDSNGGGLRELTNGRPIMDSDLPAVVQIGTRLQQTQYGYVEAQCTATFVSPRTLLTAAHCVDEGSPTTIRKGPPETVGKSSTTRLIHPNWGRSSDGSGDVALVIFDRDVAQHYYPVSLDPARLRVGTALWQVGYGMTDDNNPNSGGNKTFGTNVISGVWAIGPDFSVAGVVNGPGTGVSTSLSNGDSGGPAMLPGAGANPEAGLLVAGVASTKDEGLIGGKHVGNYSNLSYATHAQWLRQVTAQGIAIAGINLGPSPAPTPAPTPTPTPSVPAPAPVVPGVPLWLAFQPKLGDTISFTDASLALPLQRMGYAMAGRAGCAFSAASLPPGAVPLVNYYNAQRGDAYQTATASGQASAVQSGYAMTGPVGYVMPRPTAGLVPLKLYWSNQRQDNFTVSDPSWEVRAQQLGYIFVRVEGYVPPGC